MKLTVPNTVSFGDHVAPARCPKGGCCQGCVFGEAMLSAQECLPLAALHARRSVVQKTRPRRGELGGQCFIDGTHWRPVSREVADTLAALAESADRLLANGIGYFDSPTWPSLVI